jgi:TetR/AcrR family tetracycline transcriptional repressor
VTTPRRKRPPKRPQDALSKDSVVVAALSLIDRDGLNGFSMRALADALGVYPTAIYWHVEDKNALLAEVVAHALKDSVPRPGPADWRLWLKEFFRRYRAAVQRHPNVAPLIGAQLVSNAGVGPATIELILSVLAAAGFRDDHLVHAYNAVIAVQVGFVTLEMAPAPPDNLEAWTVHMQASLRGVDPGQYPMLAENLSRMENRAFIVRWQNGTEVPLDDSFELFIDIAVRGLEQRLVAHKA